MTTCSSCCSWQLRHGDPKLARLGFGQCEHLEAPHTFLSAGSLACPKHQPADTETVEARITFLERKR